MAQYLILYSVSPAAQRELPNASPEVLQETRERWARWREEAGKSVSMRATGQLQAITSITSAGTADVGSGKSGFSIVEAESKEELIEIMKKHPYMAWDDASIEVLAIQPLP